MLDTFNNEIIAHSVSPIAGDNKPYYECLHKLNLLAGKKEERKPQVAIEALNGWMKEELYLDFGLNEAENLPDLLNKYVYFFNNQRPAAALGYKSPVQYKTELGFL